MFFSKLNHSKANSKNSISKGRKKIEFLDIIIFITKKQKSRQALHDIFLKYQYNYAEVPQSFISMQSFSVNPSFLSISQPLG